MATERLDTSVRAASELAVRRAALDQALAAADDEHADVDPIDVIDCALAVQAAEALVSAATRGRSARSPQRRRQAAPNSVQTRGHT